jgi:very-long-chain enoyl-CoA reductase
MIGVGTVLMMTGELFNGMAHLALRDLKGPRSWPKGPMFSRVSCPHYAFEIMSWVGWAIVTGTGITAAPLIYAVVAAGILISYSLERHWGYQKTYGDYPAGRKAIIPYVL